MNKTLTTIVTAALLGSTTFAPLAMAQTSTQPAPAAPGAAAPATPAEPAAPATTAAPAMPGATSAASGSYLTEQGANQISANDYIGASIYTSTDESIGSVTNLIMEENGGIVAAVVGVGGFLGMGAKDVAVPMDKITVTRDTQSGDIRLTTTETQESLKSAPEFVTMKEKTNASGAAAPAAPATNGATTTAPKN